MQEIQDVYIIWSTKFYHQMSLWLNLFQKLQGKKTMDLVLFFFYCFLYIIFIFGCKKLYINSKKKIKTLQKSSNFLLIDIYIINHCFGNVNISIFCSSMLDDKYHSWMEFLLLNLVNLFIISSLSGYGHSTWPTYSGIKLPGSFYLDSNRIDSE